MLNKKYLVFPGFVTSVRDGQTHWISGEVLISLYGVDPADCLIVRDDSVLSGFRPDDLAYTIRLYPLSSGNYREYLQRRGRKAQELEETIGVSCSRAPKVMLADMLAVIHRDGGQYTHFHGMEKSFDDAVAIVLRLLHREERE